MGLTAIEANTATLDRLRHDLRATNLQDPQAAGVLAAWLTGVPLVVNDLLPDDVLRMVDDNDDAVLVV